MDGAWGKSSTGVFTWGIGGNIKNKNGLLVYVFSGPCQASSSSEAEVAAILHFFHAILSKKIDICPIAVFTDSMEAINLVSSNSATVQNVNLRGIKFWELISKKLF